MKKFCLLSLTLLCLFLFGCESSNNIEVSNVKSQDEIDHEFSMKQKCSNYKDTWETGVYNWWNDYDAYVSCETKTYYSKNLNTCIWESLCYAWWMRFYNMVDLLENTQLYSCSEVEDECFDSLNNAHSTYN